MDSMKLDSCFLFSSIKPLIEKNLTYTYRKVGIHQIYKVCMCYFWWSFEKFFYYIFDWLTFFKIVLVDFRQIGQKRTTSSNLRMSVYVSPSVWMFTDQFETKKFKWCARNKKNNFWTLELNHIGCYEYIQRETYVCVCTIDDIFHIMFL